MNYYVKFKVPVNVLILDVEADTEEEAYDRADREFPDFYEMVLVTKEEFDGKEASTARAISLLGRGATEGGTR